MSEENGAEKSLRLLTEAFYQSRMTDTKKCFSEKRPAAVQNTSASLFDLSIDPIFKTNVCNNLSSLHKCLQSIDDLFTLFITKSESDISTAFIYVSRVFSVGFSRKTQ